MADKVSRLTAPQIDYALKRVDDSHIKEAKKELRAKEPGDAFFTDLLEQASKHGLTPAKVTPAQTRALLAEELADLQIAIATRKHRTATENVDLPKVEASFGKFAADLLRAVHEVDYIPGRLTVDGKIPHSEGLALRLKEIYDELGIDANNDTVIAAIEPEYPTFDKDTLRMMHSKHGDVLPDRTVLRSARLKRARRQEAEAVAVLAEQLGLVNQDQVIEEMKHAGYEKFCRMRYNRLKGEFGDIMPKWRTTRTEDEYARDGQRLKDYVAKHSGDNIQQVADALKIDRDYLDTLRKQTGVTIAGKTSGKKRFKQDDPTVRAIVLRAFLDSSPFATKGDIAKQLSKSPTFHASYGKIAGIKLGQFARIILGRELPAFDTMQRQKLTRLLAHRLHTAPTDHGLRDILAGIKDEFGDAPPAETVWGSLSKTWSKYPELYPEGAALFDKKGKIDWSGRGEPDDGAAEPLPGKYDRAYAERVAWYYHEGLSTNEVVLAAQVVDPEFTEAKLKTLRKHFGKEMKLSASFNPEERRGLAEELAPLAEGMREATYLEIGEAGYFERGLPRMDGDAVWRLIDEFPELFPHQGKVGAETKAEDVATRVEAYYGAHPKATIAQISKALDIGIPIVSRHVRALGRKSRIEKMPRHSEGDRQLIARYIQNAEPGETQKECRAKILADSDFRHESIDSHTMTAVAKELVPEAANWKAYNVHRVARAWYEGLQQNPDAESVADVVRAVRKKHPKFPTWSTFVGTTKKTFKKYLPQLPYLQPYFVDGKFEFIDKKPEAVITEKLRDIVAEAWKNAPAEWSTDDIIAELQKDPRVMAETPVFNASTVTGIRVKWKGAIPSRKSKSRTPEEMRAEAVKWARAMNDRILKGEKIVLGEIADELGVDRQNLHPLLRKFPELFPMYKKHYELTPHFAKVIGALVRTTPLGASVDDVVEHIESSGVLPPDMKIDAKLVARAARKYPGVVPTVKEHQQTLADRVLAEAIFTGSKDESRAQIFKRTKKACPGIDFSLKSFEDKLVPRWESWLETRKSRAPEWLRSVGFRNKVAKTGLGKPASAFPASDRAKMERSLAAIAEIPGRLPMLERVIAAKSRDQFKDFNILGVQHLLGTNYRFLEAIHRMGAAKEDMITVGIPYSTNKVVAKTMREQGYEMLTPPLNLAAWERQVEDAIYKAIQRHEANGKRIVVFDDGGLVAKILHTRPWAKKYLHLFNIVEQTTRGITVASKYDLKVPIVAFALDPAKALEGEMIAEACSKAIFTRLRHLERKVKGMEVTVNGSGVTGAPTARALAEAGAKVRIYDIDPSKTKWVAEARKQGLDITVANNPKEAFTGAQMVVGCTGHQSIDDEAMSLVADDCILTSASSKLVEIDMAHIDNNARDEAGNSTRVVVDDDNLPPTATYTFANGRKLTVLADGFPVNFDGGMDNVEAEDIQLVRAGMLLAGIQATKSRRYLKPGFVGFDDKLREFLLGHWAEVNGAEADAA